MDFSIPCVHPGIFYWFSTWIICTSWSKLLLNLGANIFDKFEGYLWSLLQFHSIQFFCQRIWLNPKYLVVHCILTRCSNVFTVLPCFFFRSVIRCFWSQWWTPFGTSPLMSRCERSDHLSRKLMIRWWNLCKNNLWDIVEAPELDPLGWITNHMIILWEIYPPWN